MQESKQDLLKEIEERTRECSECDMMANHEHPRKWHDITKCPRCGKSTDILKRAWEDDEA